jgi:F0F1-type ATP synthase gamma subunit
MVRNFVSSLLSAVSVAALSVAVLSVAVVSLLSEHAARPNVALSIADNNNGDFKELSMEFILEIINLIHLVASTYIH